MTSKITNNNSLLKYIVILLLGSAPLLSCGLNNDMDKIELNQEYHIFEHMRVFSDKGDEDIITADTEVIQSLPEPVKAIIARYSTSLPDYMLAKEESRKLAKSLGDFSSLYEAQASYLKIWGKDFSVLRKPVYLKMKRTETSLIFTYGFVYGTDYVNDVFTISGSGKITHVSSEKKNRFN